MKCIYCPKQVQTGGEGDHVIPRGFGKFENDRHFFRLCRKCNEHIGRSEQQMIECGPVGDMLRKIGPIKSHGKTKLRTPKKAHGADSPYREINDPFLGVIDNISREATADRFSERLWVIGSDGKEHGIKLHPKMNSRTLRKRLDEAGVPDKPMMRFHFEEENRAHYLSIVKEIYPTARIDRENKLEPGIHVRLGYTRFSTTDFHYFRGLTKMVFHYYLVNQLLVTGYEEEFSVVRSFIIDGKENDYRAIFDHKKRFIIPIFDRQKACIILGFLEEGNGQITGHVTFNPGRNDCPEEHYWLNLGKWHKVSHALDYRCVHGYVYDSHDQKRKFVGHVEKLA
jgi:hypothetical protein